MSFHKLKSHIIGTVRNAQYNNNITFFQPVSNADFIVPVEIDGTIHQVYVLKRPYVDEFLQKMGEMFECVLFTASLAKVNEAKSLYNIASYYFNDTVR